jgi:hypothetical protein
VVFLAILKLRRRSILEIDHRPAEEWLLPELE